MSIMYVTTFISLFNLQRLALHESNISRYNAEFVEISTIGSGQFGSVHKCLNRLGEHQIYCSFFVELTFHVFWNVPLVPSNAEVTKTRESYHRWWGGGEGGVPLSNRLIVVYCWIRLHFLTGLPGMTLQIFGILEKRKFWI